MVIVIGRRSLTDLAVALGPHVSVAVPNKFEHHQSSVSAVSIHRLIDLIPRGGVLQSYGNLWQV
jgi:hypothetical protein